VLEAELSRKADSCPSAIAMQWQERANSGHCVSMDGPRNDAWPYGVKDTRRLFVSQVSAGEKGRPKTVAGWIEIAAGDKDARRRAVWLTEKER
jgi:hypothetical protein